ncbi:Spo11/DNA topoisomerase VI, subunit A domain-containing protein [Rozella allomycis CSF55]|uniref:Spo11/DNA topoisomerase VI, subunit A domain-containing protein n=1 Tax=Rozella allomycis (strain CSF55) TaxID=988480 RepID=A0A075AQR9_ROZAC|nr:Spo11/DNA topoisomerase VI, subunit A domain-containing protein [Rozella allomycis CSF55]|eukprot:EPZ32525.1 Spo11/DNA topoisomerase VI, subunit A domain-containing protein [Rozella allomycis CSF55]
MKLTGLTRKELHIVAAGKGLIKGPLIFLYNELSTEFSNGGQIPENWDHCKIKFIEKIDAILVIEKETIFNYLKEFNFPNTLLICGKGYPCERTRELLHFLNSCIFNVCIYALVDNDPHGLHIYSIYKNGSRSRKDLAVKSIDLLGLKTYQFERHMLPFSKRDLSILKCLLTSEDLTIRSEATALLQRSSKCELESLIENEKFIQFLKDNSLIKK